MKKFAQIFLLLIYTASALGVSVKGLYCCDKLRSVSVAFAGTKENKDQQDGCFKTKYQVLQVKDNHYAPDLVKTPESFYTEIAPLFYTSLEILYPQTANAVAHQSNPPPLLDHVPVYLYDCVFRI